MGSRCFLSCFSRADLDCLEALAQLGVVYHACNPSLRAEPGGLQVWGKLGLPPSQVSKSWVLLDGRELAWHLQALGSIPSTETKRRKKRRWLSYHFRTMEGHVLYRAWSTKLVFQVASARQPPLTGLVAWGSDRSLTHPENTSHTSAWGDYSLTSHTFERAKA